MAVYQQAEWLSILQKRFGKSPLKWAFRCPVCKDIATGADMRAALKAHPRTRRDGKSVIASDILGQECIGRTLGALSRSETHWDARRQAGEVRGCDWCAYGLFHGPDAVVTELTDGTKMTIWAFPIAEATS